MFEKTISQFLKAHVAGLGAALTLVLADLNTGSLTLNDWYGIVGAALGVGAAVAIAPNAVVKAVAPVVAPVAAVVAPVAQDVVAPAAAA